MSEDNYVIQISSALSNKPLFLKVSNPSSTVDSVINEAITKLQSSGQQLNAKQLGDLYHSNQLFNNGQIVSKSTQISALSSERKTVGEQEVAVISLDLVAQHSGGQ